MSEAIKRRVSEKRLARDKTEAKLASIRNLMDSYRVAEAKHAADLAAKDEVLGMLEELDKSADDLAVEHERIRLRLQEIVAAYDSDPTKYRKDSEYKSLMQDLGLVPPRIREMESDANKIYYGKMKR